MRVRRTKPYVCVDCDYFDHSRFQATSDVDATAGTWLRCLAHSRAQEQDGVVKLAWLQRPFAATFERVEDLIKVGLLRLRDDGDYDIHAYAPRNQTRAKLDQDRKAARGRLSALRSAAAEHSLRPDEGDPSVPLGRRHAGRCSFSFARTRGERTPLFLPLPILIVLLVLLLFLLLRFRTVSWVPPCRTGVGSPDPTWGDSSRSWLADGLGIFLSRFSALRYIGFENKLSHPTLAQGAVTRARQREPTTSWPSRCAVASGLTSVIKPTWRRASTTRLSLGRPMA